MSVQTAMMIVAGCQALTVLGVVWLICEARAHRNQNLKRDAFYAPFGDIAHFPSGDVRP